MGGWYKIHTIPDPAADGRESNSATHFWACDECHHPRPLPSKQEPGQGVRCHNCHAGLISKENLGRLDHTHVRVYAGGSRVALHADGQAIDLTPATAIDLNTKLAVALSGLQGEH